MNKHSILNFFSEAGQLKRVKRSGWSLAGISDPESVAEHSFRATIIGHVLARMEGIDPNQVMIKILYHDLPEARIGDTHKIARRYLDAKNAEQSAMNDQFSKDLPIAEEVRQLLDTPSNDPISIIARDADLLECLIQGKEYYDMGHTQAKEWFQKTAKYLKTKSAKELYKLIPDWDSSEWRKGLKHFDE